MAEYGDSAGWSLAFEQNSKLIVIGAGPSQPQKRRRTHKQRFSRSRTGCLTCRGRRIRCDEVPSIRSTLMNADIQTHPTCERCLELELSASPAAFPGDLQLTDSVFGLPILHLPNPVGRLLPTLYLRPRHMIPRDQEVKLQIHRMGVPRHGRIRVRQL
jgi:hypothetical protein